MEEFGEAWGFGARGRCESDVVSKWERTDFEGGKNRELKLGWGDGKGDFVRDATTHRFIVEGKSTSKTFENCIENPMEVDMQFGSYTRVTIGYLRELRGVVSHAKGVPSPQRNAKHMIQPSSRCSNGQRTTSQEALKLSNLCPYALLWL